MPELPPPPPPPLSLAAALADVVRRRRPHWATGRGVVVAAIAVGVAGAVLAIVSLRTPHGPPPEVFLPRATTAASPSALAPDAAAVAVHAAGAFNSPGLYELPSGSRVADLVEAAGGTTADALVDSVNLAARLGDGERIYMPRVGEEPPASAAGSSGAPARVDLNTATLDELDALPGIGPATAQAILDHRRARGRFASIEDLLEVRGIGEAKLASLRDRVRV